MRRSSPRARIEVAEANELMLLLGSVAEGASHASAPPELRERVTRFAPSAWMWSHLVTVVAEAPAPREAGDLLLRLERLDALEIQRRLVGYWTSWFRELSGAETIDRALRGDSAATRALLRTSMPDDSAWHASLRERLDAGPERTKRELLDIVALAADALVPAEIRPAMRRLRAAVRARRRPSADGSVGAYLGDAFVADESVREIVIVPSLVLREVHEFDHARSLFVCVPVEHSPTRASELTPAFSALADGSRLAIVRALARDDLTAQALADLTGLGLSTTLHHLAALRRVGLVARGGRRRAYALRSAPLRRLRALVAELAEVSARPRPRERSR